MKIPFHRPIFSNKIIDDVESVLSSGWVTTGKKTHLFEQKLSEYLNVKNVVAVNSCTAALHLGAIISGLKKNDMFIAPTHTFVSSVEVGEYIGATPLLVDIDMQTMNLDLNHVEDLLKKFGKNVKTIIPVHFAGNPVKMNRLRQISEPYNCFILEDAAHALESIDDGNKIGDTNNAAAFSFYANKNITTGGEGGAIATNDSKLADRLRMLSLHGMDKDGWSRFKSNGKWSYDITELGYKYNLTDVASIIGIDQLNNINKWHKKRSDVFDQYHRGLKSIEGIKLPPKANDNSKHAKHLYIIQIRKNFWKISRDELIIKLNKLGLGTSVHYRPVHMHSFYQKKYGFKPEDLIKSKNLYESSISIPMYPDLKNEEVLYVINTINELWSKYSK
tara:strand:+ start:1225 stop:2391 length:1167 start_codon:yes stop_codon:yes gene_type:complete